MNTNRDQLMKQKKTRNSNGSKNSSKNHPRTPPKYGKNGTNIQSASMSVGYNPVTAIVTSSNGSSAASSSNGVSSTNKSTVLRFDQPVLCFHPNNDIQTNTNINTITSTNKHIIFAQLKRKRMNNKQNNNNTQNASRPTFQFKIGMQVGVALGDCFLQLQKLENSMDKLRNVSEDITDVMQCIEQIGGAQELQYRAKRKKSVDKNDKKDFDDEDPIEEVHVLNDNLLKWQKDASKRMKNVSVTVTKLQTKLEDLDEYHAEAQQQAILIQKHDRTEVDKAMETIQCLQNEVQKTKMELTQKNMVMQQLKTASSQPTNHEIIREKLEKLESKEKELDRDAEIIATQSEELRKESERLLTEREEVRKQKEQWQKMIDEVKDQKAKLEKRESELQANHKKLLELHETLSEEKKKLHKKAKKIKAREKRLNALRAAQSQYVQQQNQYQVPSSNGSDYAESELTYFSDGDTEIASVNSISDDESQDNYHKQQLKALSHLGVPQNPMF